MIFLKFWEIPKILGNLKNPTKIYTFKKGIFCFGINSNKFEFGENNNEFRKFVNPNSKKCVISDFFFRINKFNKILLIKKPNLF